MFKKGRIHKLRNVGGGSSLCDAFFVVTDEKKSLEIFKIAEQGGKTQVFVS